MPRKNKKTAAAPTTEENEPTPTPLGDITRTYTAVSCNEVCVAVTAWCRILNGEESQTSDGVLIKDLEGLIYKMQEDIEEWVNSMENGEPND